MKKYTHFLVIGFLCLFSSSSFSQAQFEIVNLGNNYSASQIESALNNSNLCGYYYTLHRRLLVFNDGAIVELLNQQETSGLDDNCFIVKQENTNDYDNVWEISENGHLIRRIAINILK